MNILLFEPDEMNLRLPLEDERARHIIRVLRRQPGDSFDAGLIDGPRGKGTLIEEHPDGLEIEFVWGEEEEALPPIDLIVGLSRPQTNRKILQEATALGVRSMSFVTTERGERSYAGSRLWSTGEWRRHLIAGAAQAFTTRLPRVLSGLSLKESIGQSIGQAVAQSVATLASDTPRIVLDNYESPQTLATYLNRPAEVLLVVGAERGWTAAERELFREFDFAFAHLGKRPLRTETAVIAAVAIVHAAMEQ